MIEANPIPFEEEFPEAGEVLAQLCNNKEARRQYIAKCEATVPKSERFFQVNMSHYLHSIFHGGGGTFKREGSKPKRNEPCTCGSGKKFKKCCINA